MKNFVHWRSKVISNCFLTNGTLNNNSSSFLMIILNLMNWTTYTFTGWCFADVLLRNTCGDVGRCRQTGVGAVDGTEFVGARTRIPFVPQAYHLHSRTDWGRHCHVTSFVSNDWCCHPRIMYSALGAAWMTAADLRKEKYISAYNIYTGLADASFKNLKKEE